MSEQIVLKAKELKMKKEIGRGAFGVVNLALYRGAKVAVKQLRIDLSAQNHQTEEEFLREVRLLTSIRHHPNVVHVIGYCENPPMIVMEYLDGGALIQTLGKVRISNEKKIQICHGIALGMIHLHAEGIIHRDLAARNILLTQSLQPKVTDFGLSRFVGDAEYGNTKNNAGPVRWMAPEAIKKQIFSKKSDVWSFGVLVWEVVTNGDLPYHEYQAIPALAVAIATNKAKLKVPKSTPAVLSNVIKLCTQRDSKKRPDFVQAAELLDHDDSQDSKTQESGISWEYL